MELILDILELIFDIIIEGSNESGKPVPMIWRVLMLLVVLVAYIGLSCGCIYIGYHALLSGDAFMALLFFGLAFIIILGGIYETRKVFRKRTE